MEQETEPLLSNTFGERPLGYMINTTKAIIPLTPLTTATDESSEVAYRRKNRPNTGKYACCGIFSLVATLWLGILLLLVASAKVSIKGANWSTNQKDQVEHNILFSVILYSLCCGLSYKLFKSKRSTENYLYEPLGQSMST
eukprot:maker-scaffold_4-snap-gene-17.60-mRNA-1 protein AED:0.03 eAED:0.03 QI:51/1/1/1/0.33/0.25/4/41/140